MKRAQPFLVGIVLLAIVVYATISRRKAPAKAPANEAAPAAQVTVTPEKLRQDAAVEEARTAARITELTELDKALNERDRAAGKTENARVDLLAFRGRAWRAVIQTNWAAYQALRAVAAKTRTKETPCTICDGKGYMHFCILCPPRLGKCVPCEGEGRKWDQRCAVCLGSGKCYLCFGTGKMACPFCKDGTVTLQMDPPNQDLPERHLQSRAKPEMPVRQTEVVDAISKYGKADPKRVAEENEAAAQSPPIIEGTADYAKLAFAVILLGILAKTTLTRHKNEAEIRALSGKYLTDGREIVKFKMPELFAPDAEAAQLDPFLPPESKWDKIDHAKPIVRNRLEEFLEQAPDYLGKIRKAVQELGRSPSEIEWHTAMRELPVFIAELKGIANFWEMRPVWQMTSALELLAKRLAEKPKDVTPSTLRTIGAAADLIHKLCAPDVRPDLIINPPISVLAVDDDPLCLRAVMFALQKADMTPDTAQNGEQAVALALEKAYDVIFMDIKMPGIDGLQACTQIRGLKKNTNTPVVFVTSQSDFQTRAKSSLVGGADLMAKPFLMFEITVKVLIFTMQKRLGLAASLRREVASLNGANQIKGMGIEVAPRILTATTPAAASIPMLFEDTPVHDEQTEEEKISYAPELPALRMAAVEPLVREHAKPVETKKVDRKPSIWSRHRKNAGDKPVKSA